MLVENETICYSNWNFRDFSQTFVSFLQGKTVRTSSQSVATSVDRMNQYFTDDNGAYGGWKDVELVSGF